MGDTYAIRGPWLLLYVAFIQRFTSLVGETAHDRPTYCL